MEVICLFVLFPDWAPLTPLGFQWRIGHFGHFGQLVDLVNWSICYCYLWSYLLFVFCGATCYLLERQSYPHNFGLQNE